MYVQWCRPLLITSWSTHAGSGQSSPFVPRVRRPQRPCRRSHTGAGPPLAWRAGLLVLGVLLNAVATASYIGVHLGPGPRDGLMTGLVRRTGGSVRLVRTSIEVGVVLCGWLLGGTLGLGTVMYAVAIGPLVQVLLPRLSLSPAAPPTPPGDAPPPRD